MTAFEKKCFFISRFFSFALTLLQNGIYFVRAVSYPNKAFSAKPTLLGNRMSVFCGLES